MSKQGVKHKVGHGRSRQHEGQLDGSGDGGGVEAQIFLILSIIPTVTAVYFACSKRVFLSFIAWPFAFVIAASAMAATATLASTSMRKKNLYFIFMPI